MTQRIKAIWGMEPLRDQESPTCYVVGSASALFRVPFMVDRIERREENFGDHGLLWFDVYEGDRLVTSMQGRAVAEIMYAKEGER